MYKPVIKFLLRGFSLVLKNLPLSIRGVLIRSQIRVPVSMPKGLVIKVASTQQELEQAYRLLYESYLQANLADENASRMRLTKYHALPTTTVVVAKCKEEVVATFTLILDGPMGLPIDSFCDITKIRKTGTRLCEVSALSVKKNSSFRGGKLYLLMTTFLHRYCGNNLKVGALVCVVRKGVAPFYEAIFGFNVIKKGGVGEFKSVNDKGSAALYADYKKMSVFYKETYANKPLDKNLYNTMELIDFGENFQLPKNTYYKGADTSLSLDVINYFFNKKTDVFKSLSEAEKIVLQDLYFYENYKSLVPVKRPSFISKRRSFRFPVSCDGTVTVDVYSNLSGIKVSEVSKNGLNLWTGSLDLFSKLETNEILSLSLNIGPDKKIKIKAKAVYKNDNNLNCGLEILETDSRQWSMFLAYLETQYFQDGANNIIEKIS